MHHNNNKNHRCAICDYIAFDYFETDPFVRTMHYHKETDEHICSVCEGEIFDTIDEFEPQEVPSLLDSACMPQGRPRKADLDGPGSTLANYEEATPEPTSGLTEHIRDTVGGESHHE